MFGELFIQEQIELATKEFLNEALSEVIQIIYRVQIPSIICRGEVPAPSSLDLLLLVCY